MDSQNESVEIQARNTIIATGSRPLVFPTFGYNGSTVITSDEALDFQMSLNPPCCRRRCHRMRAGFHILKPRSKVTVVDIMPTVLPMEDPDISQAIMASLKKEGVGVKCGVRIEKISQVNGGVVAALDSGEELVAEKALLSVGRKANSEGIGLEKLGVEVTARGEIVVNDKMETNIEYTYAIGDVVGTVMLAHVASYEGITAVHNIAGEERRMNYDAVPSAIFTVPEVASVGINEAQAKERSLDVKIGTFPFRASGKALAMGQADGFVKVIADAVTDVILGVHIVGPNATDLIAEPTLAVRTRMTLGEFTDTMHAHPTLAESLVEAAEAAYGMAIHV